MIKDWNKEMEERIRGSRPIDDVFFEVLADDKEFCEEIRECTGRNSGIHIGMCQIMDELLEEYAEEMKDNHIRRALYKDKNIEDIADYIDVPVERVLEVKNRMQSFISC